LNTGIKEQAAALQDQMADLERQGQEKMKQVQAAQAELENLDSRVGQQHNKLRQFNNDAAQAWSLIQENKDKFEQQVFGPPIVECSVIDPLYVNQIEALFNAQDLTCFTVQSNKDYKTLDRLLDPLHLTKITIRNMSGELNEFAPPVDRAELRRYGLDKWALDVLTGPDKVLAMLCSDGPRLAQTGISHGDITSDQYELITRSRISKWVTGKSIYSIARRKEYGPSATSTSVRDIGKAQIWTDQPVDLTVKKELLAKIAAWEQDIQRILQQTRELNSQVSGLKEQYKTVEKEIVSVVLEQRCAQHNLITITERSQGRKEHKPKSAHGLQRASDKIRLVEHRERHASFTDFCSSKRGEARTGEAESGRSEGAY
jgi:regulator of replication initiation timing